MSNPDNQMSKELRKVLYEPSGYAIAARHPVRNEQILVASVVPGHGNSTSVPLTFQPHQSCGEHLDIRVYRIRPEACKEEPALQPGDILPLSDGILLGSICHNLDDNRTEASAVRVSIKLDDDLSGLSVCVAESPELQECYYLHTDISEGRTP